MQLFRCFGLMLFWLFIWEFQFQKLYAREVDLNGYRALEEILLYMFA